MKLAWIAAAGLTAMLAASAARTSDEPSDTAKLEAITTAMNSIPAVVFFKDREGVYRGGNTAWAELLGRPLGELVGKSDFDLFPEEVARSFRTYDQAMIASGKPQRNREVLVYPDGRKVEVETLKAPWIGKDGACVGVVGVCWEIVLAMPVTAP